MKHLLTLHLTLLSHDVVLREFFSVQNTIKLKNSRIKNNQIKIKPVNNKLKRKLELREKALECLLVF
jgi:hypothetical protein